MKAAFCVVLLISLVGQHPESLERRLWRSIRPLVTTREEVQHTFEAASLDQDVLLVEGAKVRLIVARADCEAWAGLRWHAQPGTVLAAEIDLDKAIPVTVVTDAGTFLPLSKFESYPEQFGEEGFNLFNPESGVLVENRNGFVQRLILLPIESASNVCAHPDRYPSKTFECLGIQSSHESVKAGEVVELDAVCRAIDPTDFEFVEYRWFADAGTLEGSKARAVWRTDGLSPGKYTITLMVPATPRSDHVVTRVIRVVACP